jgi:hypothetical protein
MRLLITGAGRGGTCWLAEIIRISDEYIFVGLPEDRTFFSRKDLPNLYATKLATDQGTFTWSAIDQLMIKYQDLKTLFSIRHPIRHVMAKIANKDTPISEAASMVPYNSIFQHLETITEMYRLYILLKDKYPKRVFYTKLENRITNTEKEIKNICKILNIEFKNAMLNAHGNTMNTYHQKRYGDKIDKSQAKICSNLEIAYNGFFENKKDIIKIIKENVRDIADYFNYDIKEQ